MKILVVDDEPTALSSLKRILEKEGIQEIQVCQEGKAAVDLIRREDFDIVLLDMLMPGMDGLAVLETVRPYKPDTEFIVLTALDDLTLAVKTIRLGAYDYVVKPVNNARLLLTIERAYERRGLRAGLAGAGSSRGVKQPHPAFSHIVTQNPRMLELLDYVTVMAESSLPILITGESGTGKELLARGIHQASPYRGGPFIPVNVAAVPESLFESHFFGHLKGAFTGSERDFKGYFEQANRGTLFLDEMGDLPMNLQIKLLRAIEDKTITPIGSEKSIRVEVRIVSSTNVDLDQACQDGRFRLDLLHRIQSAHVHLPPLRERSDDIEVLARHFLHEICNRTGKEPKRFAPGSLAALMSMRLGGNIRELAQVIEKAVLLAGSEPIAPRHLGVQDSSAEMTEERQAFEDLCSLEINEDRHVIRILELVKGSRVKAAGILGITVRQLQRKIARIKSNPRWAEIAARL